MLLLVGVGFFFLRSPKPNIEIKAETLWSIGFFDITNTLFTAWIVVIFLLVVAYLVTRRMELIPSGWQNAAEAVVEALYNLVVNTAGEKHARRFFPVIATLFLFIIVANWFALLPVSNVIGKVEVLGPEESEFHEDVVVFEGSVIMPGADDVEIDFNEDAVCREVEGDEYEECLVGEREIAIAEAREEAGISPDTKLGVLAPYFRSVNTDLMTPLALAIVSAFFVEYWGISVLGFRTYGSKFFDVSRLMKGDPMGLIDFFVGILEFIAEIARLISFTFRLFGNMLAGEILLLMMTFLIPLLLALPFYGLEIFVGAIQAFVFAMLTLIFGALAVAGHGEEEHAAGGEEAAATH
ncbi:MAG: F0F1 ATP synthase subunit A [Chloroflexi bacterium]|nr:F0F1 ATP synthase subunit A [Chloroflexota bacterium]